MKRSLLQFFCLAVLSAFPALADQVIINEIMYHAAPEIPEDSGQEWIELHNKGVAPVNLTGWKLTRTISFTFPNITLPPGGYLVVAANATTFLGRYPAVTNVTGNWIGTLANHGSTIEL